MHRVWALKCITVIPRGKQNDAVKWSSMRFASSIKTDVSCTCWLCSSALCLVMASTNQKKKTQLTKRCSNRAIANQVLPRIDLSSLPNQGWSRNVYPFLSVAVATSADRPGHSSGTLYSLKKVSGLPLSLQEKAKAAFKWFWESSCSALSNKVYSDQDFYFSATLLMHNKV